MAYSVPHTDEKHNPYIMGFPTAEPSSPSYHEPEPVESPTRQLVASPAPISDFPGDRRDDHASEYTSHDSEVPTNDELHHSYLEHDPAVSQDDGRYGYSDDDVHKGYPSAEDAVDAPLFRDAAQDKSRFQDLGMSRCGKVCCCCCC